MGNSGFTLYKRTHFVAIGIFAGLLVAATAAFAMIRHHAPEPNTSAVPTVGRFVVTPTRTCFIESRQERAIAKECPAR
jgi:hypothetical protein